MPEPIAAFEVSINIRHFCKGEKMQEEKSVGQGGEGLTLAFPLSSPSSIHGSFFDGGRRAQRSRRRRIGRGR